MHLVIPYASAMDPQAQAVLADLRLPALERALADLAPGPRYGDDEYSPALPQERLLAALAGLPGDAPPPLAAWALGSSAGARAWARLTPLHCDVGSDQVTALDPAELGLGADSSRAFVDALAPLFPEEEGWALQHLAPGQWFVAHEQLQGLETASLDRVIHRNVDAWLPEPRQLLRLQMEAQMTLHGHPLNAAREQAGQRPVNSVWIWGCGSAAGHALPTGLEVDNQLRAAWITGDWTAWAEAWRELDARRIAPLLPALAAGTATLSLAGERQALTLHPQPRGVVQRLWQQLRPCRGQAARLLESL
ncbi:hypothetical protein H5407_04185 [Mitsuaria sp. WAJ17]|uniref:hypothetical protein n=1 Tax=Mitsuaria sp. WAJ17 TaxID=2761452 RepID=UPI001602F849|nr:hypothetical protein [Mitsuaria sp. WAJ17]MBB2484420.1 hypothetical protein [Mitsuaria sp. WAJ17]